MTPSRSKSFKRDRVAAAAVMIVEDHPLWRETLGQVIRRARLGRVVAEAADGKEAVRLFSETSPDIVIMDINLPGLDGIGATRAMIEARPAVKVLALSSSDDREQVLEALVAGASGYLVKTAGSTEIAEAITRVLNGELVLPPALADVVLDEFRTLTRTGPVPRLRVLIAEPAGLFREGLARVLPDARCDVVGQAEDAPGLIRLLAAAPADVVVVDAALAASRLPEGSSVAEAIGARFPRVGMLALAGAPEAAQAVALMAERVQGLGYLRKDRVANIEQLGEALRRVAAGESVVDPEVVSGLVEHPKQRPAVDRLTERERSVLALMAEGRSNHAIGQRLRLGPKTVETHVRNIFMKLTLEPAEDDHRRVLAVLTYLGSP